MRPIRLELEGFTAYRELTVLDFEGAELFVLTGPTGSGKSSLIDAITFALYGSVPRYQNPKLVHPVISQGKVEAKVRFDFAIADHLYSAVRVVRKTPRGATTKEARLESEGAVLAGTADELSRKVRELLGLSFEQFTTSVVLPQGEFARFLHEKPAARQDLLTKLLGVDIYERMGVLARNRQRTSQERVVLYENELERLAGATPSARKAAEARVRRLDALKEAVEKALPELERLDEHIETKKDEACRLRREVEQLQAIAPPSDLAPLTRKLDKAQQELEKAREEQKLSEEALASAEAKRAQLPDPAEIRRTLETLDALEAKRTELEKVRTALAAAEETLSEKSVAKDAAAREKERALEALDETRRELAAHELKAHLVRGEPCPVCGQSVGVLPADEPQPALTEAERARKKAETALAKAERARAEAEKDVALAEQRVQTIETELGRLTAALEKAPARSALRAQLERVEASEAELEKARERVRKARTRNERAREILERLGQEEKRAWSTFEKTRDSLAALAPPRTDRESLAESWAKLTEWAGDAAPAREREAGQADAEVKEAAASRKRILSELQEKATEVAVALDPERPRDAVVSALAEARQESKRIVADIERAAELRASIARERKAARVAGALGEHLKASGFERWLLEEAFRRLVSGATVILRELSSGQYSFEYDEKLAFEIVDHANADERRSARTLSGGETFLASLALALTLAEQTGELASEGAARIESLFLDEGFGTLDEETLDIVAAAMEELGARGRVVGLVTHQQSLADKIPVQFRVSKGPATATVERIEA